MLELPLNDLPPPTAEILAVTANTEEVRFYIGAQIEKNTAPDDEKDQQPTPPENNQVATNETTNYQKRIIAAIQFQGTRQKQSTLYPGKIDRENLQMQRLNRTGRRNINRG